MGFQDDYVMRTISDLVKAIARLFLGKDNVDYDLPSDEKQDTEMDSRFRRLTAMAEEGDINRGGESSVRGGRPRGQEVSGDVSGLLYVFKRV